MKPIIEDFSKHLKQEGLRLTKERRQLLDMLCSIKGHFSPEQVVAKLKKHRVPVSRATVYRMIPVLVKADLIQQTLFTDGGQARFEVTWNKDHHDHLICSKCDKVIEFQDNTIEILQREIANKYGFVLDHHVMELVGRCRNCQNS